MNEREGLVVLDRRMREASVELRRAVEAATREGRPNGATEIGRSIPPGDLAPVISLDGWTPPVRKRRRRLWAAAAAVVAAVGVAGLIVVGGGDDDAPPATTVDQPFLVPGWLPPGWGPMTAVRDPEPPEPSAMVTVYGSTSLVELQNGEFVTVLRLDASEPLDPAESGSVIVAGHDATLDRDGDIWTVTVPVDDNTFVVSGGGVTRAEIRRIAAAAVEGRPVEPELPSGLEEVAGGSLDVTGQPGVGSLALRYGADSGAETVSVAQRPGRPSELGLILMMLPAPDAVTEVSLRGQRGLRAEWEDDSSLEGLTDVVQWIEPPGLLVTVWVDGLDDEPLERFIEEMRDSTDIEIDRLVEAYPEPADGSGDVGQDADDGFRDEATPDPDANSDVESDAYAVAGVVVARSGRGSDQWTVAVEETARSFRVNYADFDQSFGFDAESRPGSPQGIEVARGRRPNDLGETAVIGVAGDSIAEVVVETAGRPPLPVELYRHDEVTRTVIVGFVPRAYRDGEVVGLDSRGREVARTPLNP